MSVASLNQLLTQTEKTMNKLGRDLIHAALQIGLIIVGMLIGAVVIGYMLVIS